MSKKHFIALANMIKEFNDNADPQGIAAQWPFTSSQIDALSEFCQSQNPRFKRGRWKEYIAGNCGPNGGGTIKNAA